MADDRPWEFIGTEETMGVLCDVFLVATDTDSKISTLYFFQSQTKIGDNTTEGTRELQPSRKAKCIARIMLSAKSVDVLFRALAENKEFKPKTEEQR